MVPVMDTDFLAFIDEFLFHPPPQASSAASSLRHQRSSPKRKRYKTLWRAASTSLMKKRYSSQETLFPLREHILRELNGQSCEEARLPLADHLHINIAPQISLETEDSTQGHPLPSESLEKVPLRDSRDEGCSSQAIISSSTRKLPSRVFQDNEQSSQTTDNRVLNNVASQGPVNYGYDEATINSQQHTPYREEEAPLITLTCSKSKEKGMYDEATINSQQHTSYREEEAPLITLTCSKSKEKGIASCCHSNVKPVEATTLTAAVPKHSTRKPPRPPRASVSRSGSNRAIRLKTAARRRMPDKTQLRKQKLSNSTSNATSMWALIVTLCFAVIMLVQGILGNNSKDFDFKDGWQPAAVTSSVLGAPPSSVESNPQTLGSEHGAGASLDTSQKASRTLLQSHRSRRLNPARLQLLL